MAPKYGDFRGGQATGNAFVVDGEQDLTEPDNEATRQRSAAHELGHCFGLEHAGVVNGQVYREGNCRANYPSIMNYAYEYGSDVGFSSGQQAELSSSDLDETVGVPGLASGIESRFGYPACPDPANARIDWNLDGDCDDDGVQANIRWASQATTVCDMVAEHRDELEERIARHGELPGAVSLGDSIWIMARDSAEDIIRLRKYRSTLLPCGSEPTGDCCPVGYTKLDEPCGTWETPATQPPNTDVSSAPVLIRDPFASTNQARYFFVTPGSPNQLMTNVFDEAPSFGVTLGIPLAVPPRADTPAALGDGSSLDAAVHGGKVAIAYLDADSNVYVVWLEDAALPVTLDGIPNGALMDPLALPASPLKSSIAPSLAVRPSTGNLLLLVGLPDEDRDADAKLRYFERTAPGVWTEMTATFGVTIQSGGGPATLSVEAVSPEKMGVWRVPFPGNAADWYQHARLEQAVTDPGFQFWTIANPMQGPWQLAYGSGLRPVAHAGARSAVAVVRDKAYADPDEPKNKDNFLRLWPFADGVSHIVYGDANDAIAIADLMCERLYNDDAWALEYCVPSESSCSPAIAGTHEAGLESICP